MYVLLIFIFHLYFQYLIFINFFPVETKDDAEEKQRACDSLIMCIVTSLNQGLRNGGGIGDVLRKPSSKVNSTIRLMQMFLATSLAYC